MFVLIVDMCGWWEA